MSFGNLPCDVQPQAEARTRARVVGACVFQLHQRLEDRFERGRRNRLALVGDGHQAAISLVAGFDDDRAAVLAVSGGIDQQIEEHLVQADAVVATDQ